VFQLDKGRTRPLQTLPKEALQRTEGWHIANIHYHYADWDEAWRKQVRYALNYAIALDYKPREIDSLFEYIINRMDENNLQVASVKPEWGVLD
jgi:hypothetical protein